MGKLREEKRDVRFGRKGPAADAKKAEKAKRSKPKHTKHAIFEPAGGGAERGVHTDGAAKSKTKRAAVVGKGVKRALDDAAAASMPSSAEPAAVRTNARKAAAAARLKSAGTKPPPSAPRERKALVKRVLPLWEQIRDAKTPTAQREALIADVMRELDETLTQMCGKHDAARVVQSCYKFGTAEQREQIVSRTLQPGGALLELARSHYGHKVLLAILRRGTREHRAALCSALASHGAALAVHREGSQVLDAAHAAAADKRTRLAMYRALWGREYALFGETAAEGAESARALCASAFAAAGARPAALAAASRKRQDVASALSELALRAAEKGTLDCALVQRAAAEALLLAGARARAELAAALMGSAVDILHAPAGALAAARALALCGAKERKAFCRALKGLVGKAARELYGCAVLVALCDVTDDTVLVGKTLIGELADEMEEIATHPHAHRLLLALCMPPAPTRHAPPAGGAAAAATNGDASAAAGGGQAGGKGGEGGGLAAVAGGGDFADVWLARRLPPELQPVAQARLELAAVAAELPPLPAGATAAAGGKGAAGGKAGGKGAGAREVAGAAADEEAADEAADEAEGALGGKKPPALRRAQLRGAVRAPLLTAIASHGRAFVSDRCASAVAEAAMAALHGCHTACAAGDEGAGEGGAAAKGAPKKGKARKADEAGSAAGGAAGGEWEAAAEALVAAAFEPVAMPGGASGAQADQGGAAAGGAGRSAKKLKKGGAADAAAGGAAVAPSSRPLFAADANAGRVLKRLIQTEGPVGAAFGAKVLARLSALSRPSCEPAELAKHGGAWVWLALLEAPGTASAARTALRPVAAELAGVGGPGCAALSRALAATSA